MHPFFVLIKLKPAKNKFIRYGKHDEFDLSRLIEKPAIQR